MTCSSVLCTTKKLRLGLLLAGRREGERSRPNLHAVAQNARWLSRPHERYCKAFNRPSSARYAKTHITGLAGNAALLSMPFSRIPLTMASPQITVDRIRAHVDWMSHYDISPQARANLLQLLSDYSTAACLLPRLSSLIVPFYDVKS